MVTGTMSSCTPSLVGYTKEIKVDTKLPERNPATNAKPITMDFIRSPQSVWQKGLGGEAAAKRWPQALAADTYLAAARRGLKRKLE